MVARGVLALSLIACGEPDPPQLFAGCVHPDDGWDDTGNRTASLDLAVDGVGTDCETTLGTPDGDWDLVTGTDGDGARWTVGLSMADAPALPTSGAVHVEWSYVPGGFGPTVGSMELTDQAVWLGVAGTVAELAAPEGVSLAQGKVAGRGSDSCGRWAYHDLDVSIGTEAGTVDYGARGVVGEATVLHGGVELATTQATCPDWFVAHAAVGVVR